MNLIKTVSIIAAAICFGGINARAVTPVDISLNGNLIETNSNVYIKDGYTMLPARKIGEVLGCSDILWDDKTRTVTFENESDEVIVKIGSKSAKINNKEKIMPIAAEIVDNKTYLSARFLCETLGAEVSWNDKTHTVNIKKDGLSVPDEHIETSYTSEDLEWLAKIVHAEAQGEIHNGKVAVANVVINRKNSPLFPDSIYDVVFDKKYGIQFTPTSNGAIYNNPSKDSYKAAKQALFGKNTAGKSLYFLNSKKATSFWIVNNRPFFQRIGNHDFYL